MHHSANPSSRSYIWWIIAALMVLPIAATVWFASVSSAPLSIDVWWNHHVVVTPGLTPFAVARILHLVGGTLTMGVIAMVTVVCLLIGRRVRDAATVALTMFAVLVLVSGLKLAVQRPRPINMLVEQHETSFPSGHSLGTAALVTILACLLVVHTSHRWVRAVSIPLALGLICVMMWSRTALHVHWLSDTICGALLGIALALTVARLTLKPSPPEVFITSTPRSHSA